MQHKTKKKTAEKKIVASATIVLSLFLLMVGCVSPEAIQGKIGAIENDLGKLEKLVDQKVDNSVMAEQIGEVKNEITQKVADKLVEWTNNIEAETVNYGGAGWVVVGSAVIIIIFLGAFGLLIRMLLKKINLLKLVTCAVQKTESHVRQAVRNQINKEVENGESFKPEHKSELSDFTKKAGTFAKED